MALVRATTDLLTAADRPALTLALYWEQVLREVAARCGLPGRPARDERIALLEELERARQLRSEVRELSQRVEALQSADSASVRSVVQVARRIHAWHGEMLHER